MDTSLKVILTVVLSVVWGFVAHTFFGSTLITILGTGVILTIVLGL